MTDPLAEVMRGLRRDYLSGAPERVRELHTLLERTERGEPGALDGLRRALHKLAGSGGSYGFEEISKAGRAGEHLAQAVMERGGGVAASADVALLRKAVDAVTRAVESAIKAGESPPTNA